MGDISFRDSTPLDDLRVDVDGPTSDSVSSAALPGSGPVRGHDAIVSPSAQLYDVIWRGDSGYFRVVPLGATQLPDWGNATAWAPLWTVADLPGQGDVQTLGLTVLQGAISQGIWRGDMGYSRSIPFSASGTPDLGNASAWSAPLSLSDIEGSGALTAQSGFVDSTHLHQSYWRGGMRYARRVPLLSDGAPDWANGEAWQSGDASALPGSGDVHAESIAALPGAVLLQTIWRGDLRYRRSGPVDAQKPAALDEAQASAWDGPVAP